MKSLPDPESGPAGFSLLELLVVLIMLSIFAAVAAPSTSRLLSGLNARQEIEKITAILRYARLTAISKGRPVLLAFDRTGTGAFQLSGAVEENKSLSLGDEDSLSMEPPLILFSPEGYATPAALQIVVNNRTRLIHIDPLTAMPIRD